MSLKKLILIIIVFIISISIPITEFIVIKSIYNKPIACENKTIILTNTIETIREIPQAANCPACICQSSSCPECKKEVCVYDTKPLSDCKTKLTMANIQIDNAYKLVSKYALSNQSQYSENLTIELNKCNDKLKATQDKLNNITEALK
jgi:hypothetical protein